MSNAPTPPPLPGPAEPPRLPAPRAAAKGALLRRALAGIALVATMAGGGALLLHASIDPAEDQGHRTTAARHELLGNVKSWGYQLQRLDVVEAARSRHDLLVVDENFLGTRSPARAPDALRQLKQKPDGSRRLVLAYLSIGEAESYRQYWSRAWVAPRAPDAPVAIAGGPRPDGPAGSSTRQQPAAQPTTVTAVATRPRAGSALRPLHAPTPLAPAWLGDENPDWRGNYNVRFWDPNWQLLMLGTEASALERLIAAGFDGVYLDRADAYQHWRRERPGAKGDMTSLVEAISERARSLAPGFVIVMQNAEELLGQHRLRSALDAVAKEDLLFGLDGAEAANAERDITASLRYLKKAANSGLPVLVVEYLQDPARIDAARKRIHDHGFIPSFAPRALDSLGVGE